MFCGDHALEKAGCSGQESTEAIKYRCMVVYVDTDIPHQELCLHLEIGNRSKASVFSLSLGRS